MKRIYISAPITGVDNFMEKFAEAENHFKNLGYEVVNPAKVNRELPTTLTHEQYMKMSFAMMDLCDTVAFLDGWECSLGCNQEYGYALGIGLEII